MGASDKFMFVNIREYLLQGDNDEPHELVQLLRLL